MKIVFMGCVEFSWQTLTRLMSVPEAEIVGIVTRQESAYNADFASLEPLAKQLQVPCFLAAGNNQKELLNWIKDCQPDVVYCFGWSYLLKTELLQSAPLGVIGYHPAALPANRGRHPIIWTLALGLPSTASTFFFMNEGADSGDILSQQFLAVQDSDDAASLYQKLTAIALEQMIVFTQQLASGDYPRITQDHTKANYWRKRNSKDGLIDWRMSARVIHNLVRALTKPYVGAHCVAAGVEVKIWRAELWDTSLEAFNNIEPGKVIAVEGHCPVIKCGEGAIKLLAHEFENVPKEGCYL